MYIRSTIFSLFALVPFVLGDVIPTSPDGSTVVKVGEDIKALWDVDTSGQWNDLTIQLMTGDNLAVSLCFCFAILSVLALACVHIIPGYIYALYHPIMHDLLMIDGPAC